jgi:hypothetical protein
VSRKCHQASNSLFRNKPCATVNSTSPPASTPPCTNAKTAPQNRSTANSQSSSTKATANPQAATSTSSTAPPATAPATPSTPSTPNPCPTAKPSLATASKTSTTPFSTLVGSSPLCIPRRCTVTILGRIDRCFLLGIVSFTTKGRQ